MTKAEKIAQLEGEVGSWEALTKARQDLGLSGKDMHIDHIPSIKSIEIAYMNMNGGKDIPDKELNRLKASTTAIARVPESHKEGPTYAGKNKKVYEVDGEKLKLSEVDSKILALATQRDLNSYVATEVQRGVSVDVLEERISKVHERNINIGIYTEKHVTLVQEKFPINYDESKQPHSVHEKTFTEIQSEYTKITPEPSLDKDLTTPKVDIGKESMVFHKVGKYAVIGTVATSILSEKAEASSIPTLHLNAHLDKNKFDSLSSPEQIGAKVSIAFNAINAIQAGEEFKAGASKSVTTLVDKQAYKEGLEQTIKHVPEAVITKEVLKLGAKESVTFAGKSLLKKLPFVGLVAGIGFGISRAMDGDWKGAAMEVASGACSIVPGMGTAASVAMDAALLEKDTGILSKGVKKLLDKDEEKVIGEPKDSDDKTMENNSMDICSTTAASLEKNAESTTVTTHSAEISGEYGQVEVNTCTMDVNLIDTKEEDASVQLECQSVKIVTDESTEYQEQCKDSLTGSHTYNQEEVDQAAQRIYDGIAEKYGSIANSNEYHRSDDTAMGID